MKRLKALYVIGADAFHATYGPEERRRVSALVDVVAPPQTPESALRLPPEVLAGVQVLISGWGGPTLDRTWLERLPNLTAVFYGAGSIAHVMTVDAWRRDIVVTTASDANAVPVAEYTVAMIVLCLKRAWRLAMELRSCRAAPGRRDIAGCLGAVVGLVSLGAVGRRIAADLARFEVSKLAYDPYVSQSAADALGVRLVSLDYLFRTSDVVSIHAPRLPSTERMITGAHLSRLKHGAAFINTSSGAVVREDELIEVAATRDDVQFVLDVADKMPPDPDSPLYTLPNVMLTPHIAGSRGNEVRRMGRWIVSELERYVRGAPLRSSIAVGAAVHGSHRPVAPLHG